MMQGSVRVSGWVVRSTKARGVAFGAMATAAMFAWMATLFVGVPVTTATPTEQIVAPRLSLTVDGVEVGMFSRLVGVTAEIVPVETLQANDRENLIRNFPGKMTPPTVTLERALTGSLELWGWHEAVRMGQLATARRSASLTMYDTAGKPVVKFFLEKAWPSKLEVTGPKAGSSEPLLETVTLVCEFIQRVAP